LSPYGDCEAKSNIEVVSTAVLIGLSIVMNKKQNELIKNYSLWIIDCSLRAYDTYEEGREAIYRDLIDVPKTFLLEKAIRWDARSEFNPFENL
jgi:hypothetical protein